VRELTKKHGVLLIADEVAVGMGRTGKVRLPHEGVSPDFFVLAKGLTGGYLPLAATLATDEVIRHFSALRRLKSFFHGHTYRAIRSARAVALATLDVFDEEQTLHKLQPKSPPL